MVKQIPEELEKIIEGMGYDPSLEVLKKEDAIFNEVFFGAVGVPLNWKQWLTLRELQGSLPFCVSFSRTNCAEAKAKKDGLNLNLSDRNLAVGSKTNQVGNSLQAVAEYGRKEGIVDESTCPLTPKMLSDGTSSENWKEVFDLSHIPLTAYRYKLGNHSWVYGFEAIKQALAFSPVQIAVGVVGGWEREGVVKDDGVYYSYHAVTCYWADEQGYHVQDSVGKEFKILDKNYKIQGAKSFADLPENWKEVQFSFELTTEMTRFAWLTHKDVNGVLDLQKVFPSSNRFISLDGFWSIYDWCRKYGPIDMPEVFLKGIMDWSKISASQEVQKEAEKIEIPVKKNDWWSSIVQFLKQLFKK